VTSAALLSPGCYGRNCEGAIESFGTDAGQGRMLDEDTWESSPQDGTWLWFPRQRYYIFDLRALAGRTPQLIVPYLSANPEPKSGGNFTIGGGNLALLSNALPNRVDVKNDSCSDYYLRLVVVAAPFPPSTEVDAAAKAVEPGDAVDASAGDASDAEAGP
jgi:hypothetical protein